MTAALEKHHAEDIVDIEEQRRQIGRRPCSTRGGQSHHELCLNSHAV